MWLRGLEFGQRKCGVESLGIGRLAFLDGVLFTSSMGTPYSPKMKMSELFVVL